MDKIFTISCFYFLCSLIVLSGTAKANTFAVLAKADSFFQADYYKQALAIYETVSVADYSTKQLSNRTQCELSLGKCDAAETNSSILLQKDSFNAKLYIMRAKSLLCQNQKHPQFDCIVADYKKVVSLQLNADDYLKLLQLQIAALQQFIQDYKLKKLDWTNAITQDILYCKDFLENSNFAKQQFKELIPKIDVLKNAYLNLLNPQPLPSNMTHE